MIEEGSFYAVPVAVMVWFASTLPEDVRTFIDLAALVILLAGIFVVARYRSALDAGDSASKSMTVERDAAVYKAERIAAENVILNAKVAELEARVDMTGLALIVQEVAKMQQESLKLLSDIRTAVVPRSGG